jgi:hypothetical protein
MTEEEWMTGDDLPKLLHFVVPRIQGRKFYLFFTACCREVQGLIPDERLWKFVEMREQFIDGKVKLTKLENQFHQAQQAVASQYFGWKNYNPKKGGKASSKHPTVSFGSGYETIVGASRLGEAVLALSHPSREVDTSRVSSALAILARADGDSATCAQRQCSLLRDIFGNPFRPVALDPRWLTSSVVDLARSIYEADPRQDGGYMDGLPILADALMDAGCDSEDLLNHCRGAGPHVRGCWAVDLILGKS